LNNTGNSPYPVGSKPSTHLRLHELHQSGMKFGLSYIEGGIEFSKEKWILFVLDRLGNW
jgi:hypothetical protein